MIVGQPTVTLKLLKILKLLQKLLKHRMARLALVGLLSLATDTLAVSLLGAGEGPGSCPAAPFRGQIMGFHPSNILFKKKQKKVNQTRKTINDQLMQFKDFIK